MVRDDIRQTIANALVAAQASGRLPAFELPGIEIARPKQAEHGDYSSNVAMVVAAAIRKSAAETGAQAVPPREIAQAIADHIAPGGPVGAVEVAGPGFINIRLADAWLQQQAPVIVKAGDKFGDIDRGRGQR